MNIYLISQIENSGYDTYDSAVVIASSSDLARRIHPDSINYPIEEIRFNIWDGRTWASAVEFVMAQKIGVSSRRHKPQVVCASFNAG